MLFVVTHQPAASFENAQVLKVQASGIGISADDSCVEVYQMAVCHRSSLARTDAVRIVTRRAGNFLFEMLTVL
jgi:hypothetical protein